jgi:dTDP-4-dehydrorhamnose reductase
MKVLITGASGQLARAFIRRFQQDGTTFLAPPETQLDITDAAIVGAAVAAFRPDVIINGAAYNNVEAAEKTPESAFRVNRDAVGILAEAARHHGARLVHFGSDFVFDGTAQVPYVETDATAPLNVYGQSKLEGEAAALATGEGSLLFRVSWVFGDGTQNFFWKLREWSRGKSSMRVVWDQVSVPTYTEDIVTVTLQALEQGLEGLWHLTNSGYGSRVETARVFLREIGSDCTVIPVGSDAFPSPARRPFFSVMSNRRLADCLQIRIPEWEDAVARFAHALKTARLETP